MLLELPEPLEPLEPLDESELPELLEPLSPPDEPPLSELPLEPDELELEVDDPEDRLSFL